MPQEVKNRLFEPFFSTKLDSGGTGLGLAISNVIIKDHSGIMEFDSEQGEGTTAIVKLPVMSVADCGPPLSGALPASVLEADTAAM